MGVTTYYYKGKTADQTKGLTEIYPTTTPKMVLLIGHGIGERNSGDLTGCKKSSGWGGWGNIKAAADTYGIIQIYVNTSNNYENGEYQFCLAWAKKKYSALGLTNKIWVLGHSLGSYGAGRYAFKDTAFCSPIAGWIMSGPGNFLSFATTDGINLWQNLVTYGIKVWGVTAENDTCMGTSPTVITTSYSSVKAIDAGARIIKTVFPDTEWSCEVSHNQVLNRITSRPMYYSGGNFKLITTGLLTANNIVMNIYQWMLSNPRTSNYQDPTSTYIGPQYPTPQGTTITIRDINWDIERKLGLLAWSDGSSEYIKAASGDSMLNTYERFVNGKWVVTTTYTIAGSITKGPYKT
jgi:pimeloyl-ACP methyl ester carboxylesterase